MSLKYTHRAGVRRLPCVVHHIQRSSPKPLGHSKPSFMWTLPGKGEPKFVLIGPGHMTKMAAKPIYGITFRNFLLQNRKSYDLETLHASWGLKFYKVCLNGDPGLT